MNSLLIAIIGGGIIGILSPILGVRSENFWGGVIYNVLCMLLGILIWNF